MGLELQYTNVRMRKEGPTTCFTYCKQVQLSREGPKNGREGRGIKR